MVGWHHRLNGHEFEEAPGVGDGQGSLVCCSPLGCQESDTTEQLNNSNHCLSSSASIISLLLLQSFHTLKASFKYM